VSLKYERDAKRIANRAGLTCRVFLHKFRSTYCTQLLRDKVDISAVQVLMVHDDLATTIKYLRAIETEDKQLQHIISNITCNESQSERPGMHEAPGPFTVYIDSTSCALAGPGNDKLRWGHAQPQSADH